MNAIATITVNRLKNRRNRKTGKTVVKRTPYTGVMFPIRDNWDGRFDMLLAGPRGGVKLMTVWPNGRYCWAAFGGANSNEDRGHVHDSDLEIAAVTMGDLDTDAVEVVLNG